MQVFTIDCLYTPSLFIMQVFTIAGHTPQLILRGCTCWVFGLVLFGGFTRLSESGLSMTSWRLCGTRWPSTDEEWQKEFNAYKVGWSACRGLGVFFALGMCACALTHCIKPPLALKLTLCGALGGVQGLVGWWMVRSGFQEPQTEVKTPRVSPYRLAFHLLMAGGLYTVLLWQTLSLLLPTPARAAAAATTAAATAAAAAAARKDAHAFAAIAALTFSSGAFVAGNDAGRCCNTWPKMGDHWVPPEVYAPGMTVWRLFENPETVQRGLVALRDPTQCLVVLAHL
ncbi:cytochrome C oxidase assembly factor COX15, putative [Eimeria acervulina]|uniref:Cytochrome C oxidase assembly factor COX15, putative n=1 Tax=Eimeria acervulina TaxID=5801 RepID=U6GWC0_EIMAC|nr:cytochrome C oxidase assembly factor COX15, putative [Eimeria acervulina]CDI83907.1 cytochrome C oxidase assembly factor COX15, putative [Eimeria acervulina]